MSCASSTDGIFPANRSSRILSACPVSSLALPPSVSSTAIKALCMAFWIRLASKSATWSSRFLIFVIGISVQFNLAWIGDIKVLKNRKLQESKRIGVCLGFLGELVFGCAANWANPIVRKVFEGCAGFRVVFWVACCWVVNVAADSAFPFVHVCIPHVGGKILSVQLI